MVENGDDALAEGVLLAEHECKKEETEYG